MSRIKFIPFLILLLFLSACKNYYNDSLDLMDNLESGTTLDSVKAKQPEYITINWKEPITLENERWFIVSNIKGSSDALGMTHYLVFKNGEYQYRESKK